MVRFQDPPGTGCWIYAVKNITIQEERFMMTISQIKEDLKQYDRKQLYNDKNAVRDEENGSRRDYLL